MESLAEDLLLAGKAGQLMFQCGGCLAEELKFPAQVIL